jgi:hypothetical protein
MVRWIVHEQGANHISASDWELLVVASIQSEAGCNATRPCSTRHFCRLGGPWSHDLDSWNTMTINDNRWTISHFWWRAVGLWRWEDSHTSWRRPSNVIVSRHRVTSCRGVPPVHGALGAPYVVQFEHENLNIGFPNQLSPLNISSGQGTQKNHDDRRSCGVRSWMLPK